MLLLLAPAGVVECRDRLVETALVITAVIDHRSAAIRAVRKVGSWHEIVPPHDNRVETEMAGHRFDRPLGNVGSLRPAIAAIGIDRHCIGQDHLCDGIEILDIVRAGPVANGHRWAARRHIRQIGADIAERLDLHAEDAAVIAKGHFDPIPYAPARDWLPDGFPTETPTT